jgi:hypothetical protein
VILGLAEIERKTSRDQNKESDARSVLQVNAIKIPKSSNRDCHLSSHTKYFMTLQITHNFKNSSLLLQDPNTRDASVYFSPSPPMRDNTENRLRNTGKAHGAAVKKKWKGNQEKTKTPKSMQKSTILSLCRGMPMPKRLFDASFVVVHIHLLHTPFVNWSSSCLNHPVLHFHSSVHCRPCSCST